MNSKATTTVQHSQHLIAGLLQSDSGIEFYGLPETMEVQYIQNGVSHSFRDPYKAGINARRFEPKSCTFLLCCGMIVLDSPFEVNEAISRIEKNLTAIEIYPPVEKKQLEEIYKFQLQKYKKKQLSFYSDRLNQNFEE